MALAGGLPVGGNLHAADPLVEGAVAALAQLTDPHRLEVLPEPAFRAQLGPALGWLHVARRRDVAPEAVIGRAFSLNGLDAARALLTREALLRNLARADAWELFAHDDSARALAGGQPAPIQMGKHRGHLAETAFVPPTGIEGDARREFACLVLRADDEGPIPEPAAPPARRHQRQAGDLLARGKGPANASGGNHMALMVRALVDSTMHASPAAGYDDELPVSYGSSSGDRGTINVRIRATPGEPVDLANLGGPALYFVLRGGDVHSVRFSVRSDPAAVGDDGVQSAALNGPEPQVVYGPAEGLRISAEGDPLTASASGARTFLFAFPAREPASAQR